MTLPPLPEPVAIDLVADLPRLIFEAIGAASMCWLPRPGSAIFDSTQATEIAEGLLAGVRAAIAAQPAPATFSEPTILPDGSAFATASWPLPKDHWLYAPRGEWDNVRDEYAECPAPILNNSHVQAVRAAIKYAVRGATMCGKEMDFDPDAMVQNAVYALCGPANAAMLPVDAQPSAEPAAVVYPPDGTVSPFTVINLGAGKVQMGDSIHDGRLPALWFGKNGKGMGHEEELNRQAHEGETLAVVTFANVEALDVLSDVIQRIRRVSFPGAATQPAPTQHKGLTVQADADGVWLAFAASSGRHALLNVERIADSHGGIVSKALREWAADVLAVRSTDHG
jgi:hypothetical protein